MTYGDIGGPVTELILTCRVAAAAPAVHRGDAVALTGPYEITSAGGDGAPVFGQALADADPGRIVSVRARGVCLFRFAGTAPVLDGARGVVMSATAGVVRAPASGNGSGKAVCVRPAEQIVDVML
ncbi:MAG TPA: hypothetical protein PLO53_04840 [Candidatus Hydrogenedentes bacterium]|nr:hypothetical protein [Candidatus Hydrogenedentota bacterium]HPU97268.1 hypothetical protein [Candidatus Hydrogenedentota bacterium]